MTSNANLCRAGSLSLNFKAINRIAQFGCHDLQGDGVIPFNVARRGHFSLRMSGEYDGELHEPSAKGVNSYRACSVFRNFVKLVCPSCAANSIDLPRGKLWSSTDISEIRALWSSNLVEWLGLIGTFWPHRREMLDYVCKCASAFAFTVARLCNGRRRD